MAKNLVILSEAPDGKLPLRLEGYLKAHFQGVNVERRDYSSSAGGGNGNVVFAEVFTPIPDYDTLLKVSKSEGNQVFIFSYGIGNNQNDIRNLGIEGIIYCLLSFKPDYLEGFLRFGGVRPAAELLKGYVA